MKKMLRSIRMKLQENKGEVSVEWVLVAVIMASIILLVYSPGVTGAFTAAIASITATITAAT